MNMATSSSPAGDGSGNSIPMAASVSTLNSSFQINNSNNPQRKRRRLEDAFQTMSLQPPATDTLSSSPLLSSSILPTTRSSIMDECENRSSSIEEEIGSDDDDDMHSTSSSSINNNLALYNLLMSSPNGHEKVLTDLLRTPTTMEQSQNKNPVDDKIDELIRTSRIRAMVETLQQQKGGKKGKSKKRTNRIQDCMVTKDDFHLKNSKPGRTLNRNSMEEDSPTTNSNSGNRIRSNSLPREMKYTADSSSTPKQTQNNSMDVQMSPF